MTALAGRVVILDRWRERAAVQALEVADDLGDDAGEPRQEAQSA